ncbi:MAG: heme lyase CcmF/NrfE family subunit [Candidatus Pelagibacter sp. TMED263]|nr:MAG: heme lyase CcmF/NrfE family subunit [Candidatus Pelagibacter sp. TMED263]
MLSNVGNILIVMSILFTLSIIYSSFQHLKNKTFIISKNLIYLSVFQVTFVLTSFLLLIFAFIFSDFSLLAVYQNSHSTKPLFYKIAGVWGNHEGSLLLWINIMVIFSYLFFVFNNKSDKAFTLYTLAIQNILILGFLIFLSTNSNPFLEILPIPSEGLGLNPILQDPALAIHPPLLYLGFVGSSIYFSAAVAAILAKSDGKSFALSIKIWVLISWSFQTLGIIVGSIWAYYELGWGGFWFWDPVENASLIPWFCMTALFHSVLVLEKRNSLYSWVLVLSLITFISSVTGTFLVRSGILNSVHTFANDPSRGLYILIFLTLMIVSSFFIFIRRGIKDKFYFEALSKETFILSNNWFMMFYLLTVFIGTVYPIFTQVLYDTKISVGPPFYNLVIGPIIVPFLILMAIGPKINWIKEKYKVLKSLILVIIISCILNLIIFYFFRGYNFISNLIIISSLFLIFSSIKDFILSKKNNSFLNVSSFISHLGFGTLIFFIILNHNFSKDFDLNIKVGETKKIENIEIKFQSLNIENRKNYNAIVGNFNIYNLKKNYQRILKPEIRVYDKPETLTFETAINSNFKRDLYLTMSNIDGSEFYNVKFQMKPFMLLIWLAAFLTASGGLIRIFIKK